MSNSTSNVPVVAGIDNGKSGFIVILRTSDSKILHIEQYPNDGKKLFDIFKTYMPEYVVSEEVFMASGFRSVASTDFQIMGRYAQCLDLLSIPYEFIRAISWRPKVGIKGKGRDQLKQKAIEKAREIFDDEDFEKLKSTRRVRVNGHLEQLTEPNDNKCESALIAVYALQKWRTLQND